MIKPTWQSNCGQVQLYLGDCREILPRLPKVDLLLTDPPYGIDYSPKYGRRKMPDGTWLEPKEMDSVIGDDVDFEPSHLFLRAEPKFLFGANHYANKLPHNGAWFVWDKRCQIIPPRNQADCELAWFSEYGAARICYHIWDGMVKDSERLETRIHPTQKPIAVMQWCIQQCKLEPGATVLDPYFGSGTTAIACLRMGMRFQGVEISPKYFAVAKERIQRELAQLKLNL